MLLTSLQRHAEGMISIGIHADTDDATGDLTFERVMRCEISRMWTAEAHRHTKSLG